MLLVDACPFQRFFVRSLPSLLIGSMVTRDDQVNGINEIHAWRCVKVKVKTNLATTPFRPCSVVLLSSYVWTQLTATLFLTIVVLLFQFIQLCLNPASSNTLPASGNRLVNNISSFFICVV
jgi:hypothetical protein